MDAGNGIGGAVPISQIDIEEARVRPPKLIDAARGEDVRCSTSGPKGQPVVRLMVFGQLREY